MLWQLLVFRLPAPCGDTDQTVLYDGMSVRMLRFYLHGGGVETLITNDFSLDKAAFKMLYFLRQQAKEEYKLLKEKAGLTNFSGNTSAI